MGVVVVVDAVVGAAVTVGQLDTVNAPESHTFEIEFCVEGVPAHVVEEENAFCNKTFPLQTAEFDPAVET